MIVISRFNREKQTGQVMCKCPDIWCGDKNIKDIETYITGVQEFLDIFNSLFNLMYVNYETIHNKQGKPVNGMSTTPPPPSDNWISENTNLTNNFI